MFFPIAQGIGVSMMTLGAIAILGAAATTVVCMMLGVTSLIPFAAVMISLIAAVTLVILGVMVLGISEMTKPQNVYHGPNYYAQKLLNTANKLTNNELVEHEGTNLVKTV